MLGEWGVEFLEYRGLWEWQHGKGAKVKLDCEGFCVA